jgi:NAD(P)-dependent dehydrogenase (short-subunit alcohol dehydrogenase family)
MNHSAETPIDLTQRRILLTGASDGIGLALAGRLAAAGAELLLPVRNETKGAAALTRLHAASPGASITMYPMDLASLGSVKALVRELKAEDRPIHVLIANAGVMMPPTRNVTEDGFELQFGTNHLGHAALIGGLLPLLQAGGARVTSVTSAAARSGKIDWDDLQSQRKYSPTRAYMASKLAQMLFALELDRRSTAENWGITSNVAHPGTTLTNLYAAGPNMGKNSPSVYEGIVKRLAALKLFVQNVDSGLLPPLMAATGTTAAGGRFYGPDGLGHFTGNAAEQKIYPAATDSVAAARIWDVTEELTGVHFPRAGADGKESVDEPRRAR